MVHSFQEFLYQNKLLNYHQDVIIKILSETNISSVNPVYPITPSNGAIIFPLFKILKLSHLF